MSTVKIEIDERYVDTVNAFLKILDRLYSLKQDDFFVRANGNLTKQKRFRAFEIWTNGFCINVKSDRARE